MKHTKGPWIARPDVLDFKTNAIDIVSKQVTNLGDQISVATVFGSTVYDEDQKIANAQLIAAAPELLEALKDMVTEMYEQGLVDVLDEKSITFKVLTKRIRKAEKAIAKARGEK